MQGDLPGTLLGELLIVIDSDGRLLFAQPLTSTGWGSSGDARHLKIGSYIAEVHGNASLGLSWASLFALSEATPIGHPVRILGNYRLTDVAVILSTAFAIRTKQAGQSADVPAVRCKWSIDNRESPIFYRADSGKNSVWKIPISRELIELARRAFKHTGEAAAAEKQVFN